MHKKPNPPETIQKLIKERYNDAQAVFWSGSVSRDGGGSIFKCC